MRPPVSPPPGSEKERNPCELKVLQRPDTSPLADSLGRVKICERGQGV